MVLSWTDEDCTSPLKNEFQKVKGLFRENSLVSNGSSFISIDVESVPESGDDYKKNSGGARENAFTLELRKIIVSLTCRCCGCHDSF